MIKISHSQKETYLQCSYKWKLHYKDRLRSWSINSALFFGKALDEGFNRILLEKKKIHTEEELILLKQDEFTIFKNSITNTEINGKLTDISKNIDANYFMSDLDINLLKDEDITNFFIFSNSLDYNLSKLTDIEDFLEDCIDIIKKKKELIDEDKRLYNYICWLSLVRKGEILLKEYREVILPIVHETHSIQEFVELNDGEDSFIGYIDAILSFIDNPTKKYIVDNKTSSKPYKDDSVRTSEQLAAYCEYKKIYSAAYVVIEKKLRKKEPKVRISVIKDEINEDFILKTFDKITNVIYDIEEEKFIKNYNSCFAYGQKCAYYDYCRSGDRKNLIDLNNLKDE